MNLTKIAETIQAAKQDILDHSHETPAERRVIYDRNFEAISNEIAAEAAKERLLPCIQQQPVETYWSIMQQVARRLAKALQTAREKTTQTREDVWDALYPHAQWAAEKLHR